MGRYAIGNVIFLDPNLSLQIKVGERLDKIFKPELVVGAEQVIAQASDFFLDDCRSYLKKLHIDYQRLLSQPSRCHDFLPKIADDSFHIKTEAGMAGCTLTSQVAKSLQIHAEKADEEGLAPKRLRLMNWHVDSIDRLVDMGLKGLGGEVGEAILDAMIRLHPNPDDDALPAPAPRNSFRSALRAQMACPSAPPAATA